MLAPRTPRVNSSRIPHGERGSTPRAPDAYCVAILTIENDPGAASTPGDAKLCVPAITTSLDRRPVHVHVAVGFGVDTSNDTTPEGETCTFVIAVRVIESPLTMTFRSAVATMVESVTLTCVKFIVPLTLAKLVGTPTNVAFTWYDPMSGVVGTGAVGSLAQAANIPTNAIPNTRRICNPLDEFGSKYRRRRRILESSRGLKS